MELIMQSTFLTCGQACIAMITGKSYDPEFGLIEGKYTHGKVTSFLEIYC